MLSGFTRALRHIGWGAVPKKVRNPTSTSSVVIKSASLFSHAVFARERNGAGMGAVIEIGQRDPVKGIGESRRHDSRRRPASPPPHLPARLSFFQRLLPKQVAIQE